MSYTKQYNKARNEWWIFRVTTTGAELIKVLKTENAADKWIAKHA